MTSIWTILTINLTASLLLMVGAWRLSILRGKACVVDSFWGIAFALQGWIAFALSDGFGPRAGLIAVLTTIWALRLFGHVTLRNWNQPEDRRYAAMRGKWGERFPLVSLFTVFLLQGFLAWVIFLPGTLGVAARTHPAITPLDVLGTLVWGVGFFFETVGDQQLLLFKADPGNRGKVMDRGLWSLTRHPNYFGEATLWWGIWLIAASTPYRIPALIGPVLLTYFLLKVSGVAMAESGQEDRRPGYADYKRRTRAFFPGRSKPEAPNMTEKAE